MRFLFNDQSFSFEALRALGYAPYGGADVGEFVSTAGRIPDGDETAWYTQWRVTRAVPPLSAAPGTSVLASAARTNG